MAQTIGIIGGTGPEGKGLAARFALSGYEVVIGSRSAERGEEAASEIVTLTKGNVRGATNADAAAGAELVVLTIPYAGLAESLEPLADAIAERIVISTVVPLRFTRARVAMLDVADGSAAQEAQRLLPNAKLVGAFHNLSASHLIDVGHALEGDVVVCSDDAEARAAVIELTSAIRDLRGIDGGMLANSHYVEAMTAMILNLNRTYRVEAGIRFIGV